jgi:hypothetical protein
MTLSPFHVAIAARNLLQSRQFYGDILGFAEGRSSDDWVDGCILALMVTIDPSSW